jgi:beta-carotene ketolase (CrtW type)
MLILAQTHLYTGLFITAHDAMHGTVTTNRKVNRFFGELCTTLFVYNRYSVLAPKHYAHHRHVATEHDPDYHPPHLWSWFAQFMAMYVSWQQILLAAITFNILSYFFSVPNVLLFWVVPAFLSTFQLFMFGTYLPHRGTHAADNKHKSRSGQHNHAWAFVTCYFFGYHYEHHDSPHTPWWLLPALKDASKKKV